jgi:hypothetical protein
MRVTRDGRTPRMVSILAALGMLAGMLSVFTAAAIAAPTKTCRVENTTSRERYAPSTGASLQLAINEADSGDTLEIRGRCVGVFTIDKTLTLIGVATRKFPVASLDANGADDHVVSVTSGGAVTITDLTITGAHCLTSCLGGGISNFGTIILTGSTQVTGNTATSGGGIFNLGTVVLEDASTVSGNTAGNSGGGIFNRGIVTLNDSSSVIGNTAGTVGGGIVNDSTGTVTLNESSSVTQNEAAINGGGIFNLGTVSLNDAASVSANRAGDAGGGILSGAGGTVTLNDSSSVSGNTAASDGGGIYNNNGSVTLNGSSSVSGNIAGLRGGGIFIVGGPVVLNESSSVSGNSAPTCPDIYPCT